MDLTRGEWAIVAFFALWGTINGLGGSPAFIAGAYTGSAILAALIIGAKRQINGWRRARAADT